MDARGHSLPLEGNLCFILILVVYFVNILAGTEVYSRSSQLRTKFTTLINVKMLAPRL